MVNTTEPNKNTSDISDTPGPNMSALFHITGVEIDGFWGQYRAVTKLHSDVNIIIGRNGSGKTTFINLLQGALRVDLRILTTLDFKSITITLRSKRERQTIIVNKNAEGIAFQIGSKSYTLPADPRAVYEEPLFAARRHLLNARMGEAVSELKGQIGLLINVASLSVHRVASEAVYVDEEPFSRRRIQRPAIDQRLEDLVQQLTKYQLSLAGEASKVSSNFQHEVLVSMLYNKDFDTFDPRDAQNADIGEGKEGLTKAYKDLGTFDSNVSKRIDEHIAALRESVITLRDTLFSQKETNEPSVDLGQRLIDSIMPFPLLKRTQYIINLSLQAQGRRQQIFQPIERFVQILREFIDDKEVDISNGELAIRKDGKRLLTDDLSSGEKQLLILLIETLLQKEEPFVFLADEPELSLHVEWQAKVISSIKILNPRSQVIVATHSPEIAGGWKGKIIDMEDVIHA